ncbi:tRNA 2-selenouridine(34) synthase MnmH [Neptunomonas antarctica]|uniref:tRNA 2-selenouridine synthase n=1 Tax=Neptunomonas antarctica TaxID=619304 RepID=A0A1N7M9H5_9GAMM|nr:tRNA 2-selenouridine(34) synthase MnmH [Neptunomonas antarctica]SIS82765.1 tRNA 2-selenouridine synthase [Neptunomonas antarctica]
MEAITDFKQLFLSDTPMLDVRAPVEFINGAFPCSINAPLMNNDERKAVGTCYKKHGADAAVELGHQLVFGEIKAQRVQQWQNFANKHPNGVLYCFRGGLRSRIAQQWLSDAGIDRPYVEGGYKAMRTYLLKQLHQRVNDGKFLVLSGKTGSGKTEVINAWPHAIDLEGLACHRGSAFGKTFVPQPAQIDFENAWSIAWLKRIQVDSSPILIEDEGHLIGRVVVLQEYLAATKFASNILLEVPFEERIARIRRDYFMDAFEHYHKNDPNTAHDLLDAFIREALLRIKKRLGGERFTSIIKTLDAAIIALKSQNQWSGFDDIIDALLSQYYDPMYEYQYQKQADKTIFKGSHAEIIQWLATR